MKRLLLFVLVIPIFDFLSSCYYEGQEYYEYTEFCSVDLDVFDNSGGYPRQISEGDTISKEAFAISVRVLLKDPDNQLCKASTPLFSYSLQASKSPRTFNGYEILPVNVLIFDEYNFSQDLPIGSLLNEAFILESGNSFHGSFSNYESMYRFSSLNNEYFLIGHSNANLGAHRLMVSVEDWNGSLGFASTPIFYLK